MDYIVKDPFGDLAEDNEEEAAPNTAYPFELVAKDTDDEPTLEVDMKEVFAVDEVEIMVPIKAKVSRSSGVHSFSIPTLEDVQNAVDGTKKTA